MEKEEDTYCAVGTNRDVVRGEKIIHKGKIYIWGA